MSHNKYYIIKSYYELMIKLTLNVKLVIMQTYIVIIINNNLSVSNFNCKHSKL